MPSSNYRIKLTPLPGHEQCCPRLHFPSPVPSIGEVISASVNVRAVVTAIQLEAASPWNMAPDRRVPEVCAVEVPLDSARDDVNAQVQLIVAAAEGRAARDTTNWGKAIVERLRQAGYDVRRRTAVLTPANIQAGGVREVRPPTLVWP